MTNKCKILIAYHRPAYLLKSNFFYPIHVGRDIALAKSKDGSLSVNDMNWLEQNMPGDNTGDNISTLNRYYSELTALYWAWKNYDQLGNPEYIGLMQYRRHFILDETILKNHTNTDIEDCYSILEFNYTPENYEALIGLNDNNIENTLKEYDFVTVKECDFSYIGVKNVKEDYVKNIPGVKEKDYDIMLEIVSKKYPKMRTYLQHQLDSTKTYLYQMFILPKDEFFKYMEFLFGVLSEIQERVDFSDYTINGQRTLGYLGEKLFDCYIRYLHSETNLKHKELQTSLIYCNHTLDKLKKLEQSLNKLRVKKILYKIRYKLTFSKKRKIIKGQYLEQKKLIRLIKNMKKGNILCN